LTVSTSPPVSLHAIRNSFNKSGGIAADERYVRDFNQLDSGEGWDLLAYQGQAFGLQYKIFEDGWLGGNYAGTLPLDETDKRIDGRYSDLDRVPYGTYAIIGEDGAGKYAELGLKQYSYQDTGGAVAMNGRFYASETGQYRVRATVETLGGFPGTGQANVFVFGYRYGYLDGDRVNYSLWGNGVYPGANQTLYCDQTFTVQQYHRHIVVNPNVLNTGSGYNESARMRVRDLTIEKV
jgi:hypothetical protein